METSEAGSPLAGWCEESKLSSWSLSSLAVKLGVTASVVCLRVWSPNQYYQPQNDC